MQVPVYIDDKQVGAVVIEPDGAGARITARLRDPGRVVRLTLYGETALYLGVPVPGPDGLVLEKRLRPGELPPSPHYAAERAREAEEKRPRRVLWHGGRPHYFQ